LIRFQSRRKSTLTAPTSSERRRLPCDGGQADYTKAKEIEKKATLRDGGTDRATPSTTGRRPIRDRRFAHARVLIRDLSKAATRRSSRPHRPWSMTMTTPACSPARRARLAGARTANSGDYGPKDTNVIALLAIRRMIPAGSP
jgi:hypothetical protein